MNRGQLALVARLHAEQRSRSDESQQLSATQDALAEARTAILELGAHLGAERRAREEAEAKIREEQHACQEAMRLLEETVQPLRESKALVAEHERKAEGQERAYAELEGERQAAEAELREMDAALARVLEHAEKLKLLVEAERCVREDAEIKASTEQHARYEALRALVHAQNAAAEQRGLAEEQAQAYAELDAKHQALEAQWKDAEPSLERAVESVDELKRQAEIEGRAREEAEAKLQAERQAREEAVRALRDIQNAAEEQKPAQAAFEKRRRAVQTQLKEMEEALAQAEYRAYRHAQRHAELIAELEKERRAREDAEKRVQAERRAREETVQALRQKIQSSAFWKKLPLTGR